MSLVSTNKIDATKYELEIKIDAEGFEKAVQTAYMKARKKININGFRKGKAPRKMIEQIYGENVFYEDAVNDLVNTDVAPTIEETDYELVATPEINVTSINKADGVTFKVVITVKPEVEISDYKGISVKKTVKTVNDEAINAEIDKMRSRLARLITVDNRAVESGDTAVIDFEGFADGVAFEGGKGEKFPLEIGSGTFIPGFEDQIIGKNIGEEFDVNVTFPENYQSENLKGKAAVFKCKLHEIKAKELPEVDDDFVKDVSEKDTVDELKAEIRERLEKQFAEEADDACDTELMDKMLEKMKAEIPQVMYEHRIDEIAREWVARSRIDIKDYLKYTGMTMAQFRANFKDAAKRQVELRLALEKIAQLENIEISEDDINNEYNNLAEQYQIDVENVKNTISEKTLTADLKIEKALDLVKNSANIEEVTE